MKTLSFELYIVTLPFPLTEYQKYDKIVKTLTTWSEGQKNLSTNLSSKTNLETATSFAAEQNL